MNLKITSQVSISTGQELANCYGLIDVNTDALLSDGKVACALNFYIDGQAKDNNMDTVTPVVMLNQKVIDRVKYIVITLTEQEILAANLPGTIYQKVADKLIADYGWTVVVEN